VYGGLEERSDDPIAVNDLELSQAMAPSHGGSTLSPKRPRTTSSLSVCLSHLLRVPYGVEYPYSPSKDVVLLWSQMAKIEPDLQTMLS
jgi:hypothetical protein